MVDKFELAGALGFGLLIGWFFGFVLSNGNWLYSGVTAAVLTVIALIYAVKFGNVGEPELV